MGLFKRINKGLKKTRDSMSGAINAALHGKNEIDDEFYEEMVQRREKKKQDKADRKKYQEMHVNDDYVGRSEWGGWWTLMDRNCRREKVVRQPRRSSRTVEDSFKLFPNDVWKSL